MISSTGMTFQPNINNFVLESNRKSFRDGLITTAIFGNKMPLKYDSYLYKNYHLRYIFNGTRALYDLAPNSLIQEQIICMYKEVEEDSSLAASCRKDYLTLENLYRNFDSAVSRYTQGVTNIAKLQELNSHRAPRGLISGIAIGTMIGGGAAGILTKLFSNSLSIQELEKSSRRTEEVLGQLASRTNLLDVNQIMLNSAINNASKLIRLGMFKDNIQSVKIHANSLSIFLEKRLELLQRLTGTPISSRSYLLSISLPEIRKLITTLFPEVRLADIHDRNVLYSFQTDGKQQLFLILKILLPNKLKIQQLVKAISWPKIVNDSLVSRSQKQAGWFMLLSSEHYIEVSNELANKCMKFSDKCMSNRVPKAIISGIVPQHIAQYFRMKEASNGFVKSYSKLFLLNIEENTLIYTSLRNTEIRISCENEKPKVSNLIGRGVLKITRGCKVS